jgi:fructokinase
MKFKLVGIGEVLWDLLPGGRQLGGAPGNFVYHVRSLGAEGRIISRVGQDADGDAIRERLRQLGVSTDCIEIDPTAPTGTVSVQVAPDGQPQFTIHEHVAWDRIAGAENSRRAVAEADATCFGTLAQRSAVSRATIRRLLTMTRPESLRIFDVNLRQHFYSRELIEESLVMANVLKVNDGELQRLGDMFGISGEGEAVMAQLARRHPLRVIACTRGADGSLLLVEGRWSEHRGVSAKLVDTVGAGDSFTAAMTLGLLAGWDLDTINDRANRVAAYVASCAGATPALPGELRSPFLKIQRPVP